MQFWNRLPASFFFLSLAFLAACNRKPSDTLLENDLTRRIPPESYGFLIAEYTGTKAVSAQGGLAEAGRQLAGFFPQRSFVLESTIASLSEHGLLGASKARPALCTKGVFFLSPNRDGRTIDAALYSAAPPEAGLAAAFNSFKGSLRDQGYNLFPETFPAADGFSIKMDVPGMKQRLFYAASETKLAVASDPLLVRALFEPQGADKPARALASPAFAQALTQAPLDGSEYSVGFLDIFGFLSAMAERRLLPAGRRIVPELPFKTLIFTQTNPAAPKKRLVFSLAAKSPRQSTLIASLAGSGNAQVTQRLPQDTMLFLAGDGQLASAVLGAFARLPEDRRAKYLASLGRLNAVAIALRPPRGALPFPEVMLVFDTGRPDDFKREIQEQLSKSGLPLAASADKQILGETVSVSQSFFGPGVFLAASGKTLLAASSEGAIMDLIRISQDKSPALSRAIEPGHRDLLSHKDYRLAFYLNFIALGQTIANVQQSLAMFTGGKFSISPPALDQVKALGTISGGAGLTKDLLVVDLQHGAKGES